MDLDPDSYLQFHSLFNLILLQSSFINPPSAAIVAAIVVMFCLIICSAIMSSSEIAFFSITNVEKDELRESDDPADKKVLQLIDNPKYLLSTILIGNNIVNIGVIIISYYIITNTFNFRDVAIGGFTIPSKVFDFTINIVIVTSFLVLFGEAIPKIFATHNKLKIARLFAPLFIFLNKLFYPITFLMVSSTTFLEKKIKKHSTEIDIAEINMAIEMTADKSPKSTNETKILKSIIQFGNTTVKQIMRPRTQVMAIDVEWNFAEMLLYIKEHGYSRFPVFEEDLDNIKGILYTKDLLAHIDKNENYNWQNLIRPAMISPEIKKIDDLMREFQENRKHIAIVVDEFGGTAGIITLEDIVEEVIGDIKDEFDETQENFYKKIDDKTYIFDGMTPFYQFCEWTHIPEDFFAKVHTDAETLGGFLTELKGLLPKNGDVLQYENITFRVLSMKNNRVDRAKVEIK